MAKITEIERLSAIQQIQDLQAQRSYAVDNKKWDLFESLHAPDHVSQHTFGKWTNAKEAVTAISKHLADKVSMHHLHTPIITLESPTKASGIWAMEDHIWWKTGDQEHWYHGYGFYYETYEKRGDGWVFTTRELKRHREESSAGSKVN